MQHAVQIENIEELRLREGIDDVELQAEIQGLRAGDVVKLTFLNAVTPMAHETLLVRITSIRGDAFRGKLANAPAADGLSGLHEGSTVTFTPAHIHSRPNGQPTNVQ